MVAKKVVKLVSAFSIIVSWFRGRAPERRLSAVAMRGC
jgi:hypothetical protein